MGLNLQKAVASAQRNVFGNKTCELDLGREIPDNAQNKAQQPEIVKLREEGRLSRRVGESERARGVYVWMDGWRDGGMCACMYVYQCMYVCRCCRGLDRLGDKVG